MPGLDPLTLDHQGIKACAAEVYGVEADVQQHLHTRVMGDAERMTGVLPITDHPGQWCTQHLRGGINANAVTHQATGEHRVRDIIKRQQHASQWRQQFQLWGYGHELTYS